MKNNSKIKSTYGSLRKFKDLRRLFKISQDILVKT